MKEFKLFSALRSEINRFLFAGRRLNGSYRKVSVTDVETLVAAREYASVCASLKTIMNEYMLLIEKDVSDMQAMRQEIEKKDSGLSKMYVFK